MRFSDGGLHRMARVPSTLGSVVREIERSLEGYCISRWAVPWRKGKGEGKARKEHTWQDEMRGIIMAPGSWDTS
jgi:hypothetical protein